MLERDLIDTEKEDTQYGRYLTFQLGKEEFGIEIRYVTEIVGMQPITVLPEMPEYMKGIINLRGKVFPVMDVRMRFHKEHLAYSDRTCIIVVDMQDTMVGLIVDQVAEVTGIDDKDISPPPDKLGIQNMYLKGIGKVGKEVKLLIDVESLFENDSLTTAS